MRAIVINFDLLAKQWLRLLFVEKRDIFFRWMETQKKVKPEEIRAKMEEKGHRLEVLLQKGFDGDLNEIIEAAPQDALDELIILIRPMIIRFDEQEEEEQQAEQQ